MAACTTNVIVDFDDPAISGGVWSVPGATARFVTSTGATATTCNNFEARLAVDSGAGLVSVGDEVGVDNGLAHFTFASPLAVNPIVGASVVVDGATLAADLADL